MELDLIWAWLLILMGMVFLVAELFLPTGGILFVLGIAALVVGVGMTYQSEPAIFMTTLIVVVVGAPVLFGVAFYFWPRTAIGKRFFLAGTEEDATLANLPTNLELEQLRGRYGRALSSLRPAGVVDFDGRRVDTLSEGIMIEPGQWVRCIDVKAGRVIVRPVDRPPDLENMDPLDFR